MVLKTETVVPYETDDINIHNQLEQQGFHCVGSKIKNGKEVWAFAETRADIQAETPGTFLVKKPSADELRNEEVKKKAKSEK